MIDEVMETGQTPHRAEYLEDGTMVQGKQLLTTTEKKANLRKYLSDKFQYSTRVIDEIQETGEAPSLKYMDKPKKEPEDDAISPPHYQQGNIQVLDFITDQNFTYLEGNIVKYICRYKTKNGLEDLEKAEYYLKELKDTYCADIKHKFAQQIDEDTLCG
jgi:hypothetical protein